MWGDKPGRAALQSKAQTLIVLARKLADHTNGFFEKKGPGVLDVEIWELKPAE